MKIFIVALLFMTTSSWALTGAEAWKHANHHARTNLLKEYQDFFGQYQEEVSEFDEKKVSLMSLLFESAWAASPYNCIYAGWPSLRVNNKCSSPAKHNSDYKNGSCGSNEMQCQPLLFGKGLCAPVSTAAQRSGAYSNCAKQFKDKKRSPESVVKEVTADGNEKVLFELMDFADKICAEGKQASTPMCRRLEAAVSSLRHFAKNLTVQVTSENTRQPTDVTTVVADTKTDPAIKEAVVKAEEAATVVAEINSSKAQANCDPVSEGKPFDRESPRDLEFEYQTTRTASDPSYDNIFVKDRRETDLRPLGFVLKNVGPNSIAGEAIKPGQKTMRDWKFFSEDNSRQETFLWVTDDPASGRTSDLMDSMIMIVPRKMVPTAEAIGDELVVTLTTGEKVVYDKNTKMVKDGVIKEGRLDTSTNRETRKFADLTYSGTGIAIRINHRGEDPRLFSQSATVTQNGKSCTVPTAQLWNRNEQDPSFKFADDANLIKFLNQKCPARKFKL